MQPWIVGALLIGLVLVTACIHVVALDGLGRLINAIERRMGLDVADPEDDSED